MSDEPTIHQAQQIFRGGTAVNADGVHADAAPTLREVGPAPMPTIAMGQQFGEYELLTEVARGGMGVVYRARQTALGRIVALKMILSGRLANPEDVSRFLSEAQAAATLKHPNIVPVHDVGNCNGQHYFTMDYIEGISLDQKIAQGPLNGKAAARYLRTLARAVHHAHKQGILHRDLKPSNVLVDIDDEPHITDFGLAKRLGGGPAGSGQTRSGAILGTPSYMSPEQAQGKTELLGPPADVYSLGAILYELITGRPPFRAETPLDTVMQVIDHQPVPPRLLNPNIDHDLETICLKCLEKNIEMRYATAEELADDLQRYLDGDSINARSFNMLDRLAHVLERDTHTADFSTWSSMLFLVAIGVALEHFTVFLAVSVDLPNWVVTGARGVLFLFLAGLFYYHRGSRLLPTTAAERELWTIWIGYFTAYFTIVIVTHLLGFFDIFQAHPDWPAQAYFEQLLPYPFLAMVSGLAFFVMGANYWGRCYAIGAVFFAAAALMPIRLTFAPLLFGILWAVILLMLGWHLRSQAAKTSPSSAVTAANHPSQVPTVQYKGPK